MFNSFSRKIALKFMALSLVLTFSIVNIFVQQPVKAESSIDTSEPVHLKWTIGGYEQADLKTVENAINKYLKSKINATLELDFNSSSDYDEMLLIKCVSGEADFDICSISSGGLCDYRDFVSYEALTDITDMLDTCAPKTTSFLGKNILGAADVDGRIYGIPTYRGDFANNNGILLNKKLVQKYKVDTSKIKKLQDLEPILQKFKTNNSNIIGFYPFDIWGFYSVYSTLNYDKIIPNFPGAVLRDGKSTKVINDFETADAKSLFSLMYKWYKSGYIKKAIQNSNNYFEQNKSNIFAMYSYLYPSLCEDILINEKLDMIPISLSKPSLTTSNITYSMQAISSYSQNPERALMLLELVNTDEKLSNMLEFGIEGIHYKKTGDKTISRISPRYTKYDPEIQFGNGSIVYSLPGHNPKVWDKVKENIDKAVVSPLLGFSFDSDPINDQMSKVISIQNKYYTDLSMGKLDPATTLPKMNAELKKAGLQKVLTEMQKQVDAFVEAGN